MFYENGQEPALRTLAGNADVQPVDFYVGEIERKLIGPLQTLVVDLLFAGIALLYLQGVKAKIFWLAVFGFYLVTRPEVLLFPPYGGDAVTAPFAEAVWLARHHFDYLGLLHQPGYNLGGPRVYFTSIYPSFLALQMVLIPSQKLFLVLNHLFVFGFAAAVVALLRQIFLRFVRKDVALLASVALMSLPLWQSQVEMINMEMACLFFTFLSAYYICEKRFLAGSLFAVAAAIVKGPGVISCSSVFVMGVLCFIFSTEKKRPWKTLVGATFTLIFGLTLVWLTNLVHNRETAIGYIHLFAAVIVGHILFYVFLLTVAAFLVYFVQSCRKNFKEGKPALAEFFQENYAAIVIWVYCAMWFLLYMNFTVMLCRYKLLVYPFLFFCICFTVSRFLSSQKIQKGLLWLVIGVASFCAYGQLELEQANFHYIQIERSLEYRNVLLRDIRLAREIEKTYSNFTIAAPSVIAHFLAWPELGYVQKQRDVVLYGMTCGYESPRPFTGLKNLDTARTVWVGYQDDLADDISKIFPYPVDPSDHVFKEIVYGERKATLFLGGMAIEKMRILAERSTKRRNYGRLP